MDWYVKPLAALTLCLAILAAGLWLMYQEALAELDTCQVEYTRAAVSWRAEQAAAQAKVDALGRQVGSLEATVDQWRTRALDADTTERIVLNTVYKHIPADCQACVEAYELDRVYSNPGPEPEPEAIQVTVKDVLGLNEASWSIDMPALCPGCPVCQDCDSTPSDRGLSRQLGMLADIGAGYGIAGPEVDAGLYPLVYQTNKYQLLLGGRAHANLTEDGSILGNALLEVRLGRTGSW